MTANPSLERARALVSDHEARVVAADPRSRREQGRYYTPAVLVRLVASRVLGPLVLRADTASGGDPHAACEAILRLRVLDPACGGGAFLLGALEVLALALVARGFDPAQARARVVSECLLGLDTDEAALALAGEALAVASGGARARGLTAGDALADGGLARAAGVRRLDAVLGNPPYRREKDARSELALARTTDLGRRHGSGKMDLWFLFAHAAFEALPAGGRHGFVVPAYWLESHGAAHLRAHLREALALDLLVELGARRFFADVQGRHVVYVGERRATAHGDRASPETGVERVVLAPARAGETDLEGPLLLGTPHPAITRRTVPETELWLADGRVARASELASEAARVEAHGVVVPEATLIVGEGVTPGPEAWTAAVGRRAALALGTTPEALEAERGIARGAGVFVLSPEEVARAGLEGPLEQAWLRPWAAPSAIPAYPGQPTPTAQIAFTARTKQPTQKSTLAVPERILAHLERFRPALDRRRETLTGRRQWFELHWPRDPVLFLGPRVLLPRMVARPHAAFVESDLVVGESVLVLRFPDRERTRLAAALLGTAPLGSWLLERAKRRGVGIDVSVALARRIPWPRALVEGELEAVAVVARALERGDQDEADRRAWELYLPRS